MAQDNPNQQAQPTTPPQQLPDLEALIAAVEQRIVENLARLIEQMAQSGNGS